MAELAQIGVTGLAVMGRNLARNFARHGHRVAIHNRSYAKTESLLAEAGSEGTFVPSESMEDFVASLERPRRVLIMVKAGAGTDAVIDELTPLLEEGDIVDRRRQRALPRHHPPRGDAGRDGPALRRLRRLRRRGGRAARPVDHARRLA